MSNPNQPPSSLTLMTTAAELIAALQELETKLPGAYLVKNQVGNLAIIGETGELLGYVDLASAEAVVFEAETGS
jgi:hypothetical protein